MIITLLAAFLLIVAAYIAWWAVASAAFLWLLASFVAAVAAVGLFLRKRWGEFLWYVVAVAAIAAWALSVAQVALSEWPYHDVLSSLVSLIPGALLLIVFGGGSVAVAKHFRGGRNAL